MMISQVGINLIKSFEGCELSSYADPTGVLTIGYGHTGVDVIAYEHITQARAEAILNQDLEKFVTGVSHLVSVPLNQNQFDSLVSLAFNIGLSAFKDSTLLQKLNQKDYAGAANEFPRWCHAGGRILDGLVLRRKAEQVLFNKPVDGPPQIVSYKIQPGDNLSTIAIQHKTTVQQIMNLNPNIKNPNMILAGSIIKLPN